MKRFIRSVVFLVVFAVLFALLVACSGDTDDSPVVTETQKNYEVYYEPTPEENVLTNDDGIAYASNELIVIAKDGVPKSDVEVLAGTYNATIVGYIEVTNYYQWRFETLYSYEELQVKADELSAESIIEAAEIQRLATVAGTAEVVLPDDSQWSSSWDVTRPDDGNWGAEAIYAPFAWHYRSVMTPVRVGLMDSMFDTAHEDLSFAQTFYNPEVLTSDHGTHVAATMAADFDNTRGISGIYPFGQLNDLTPNIYGYSYTGTKYSGTMAHIAGLAELIVNNDVRVINVSYGFDTYGFLAAKDEPGYRDSLKADAKIIGDFLEKILKAQDTNHDFVIVQAAGNERNDKFKKRSNGEWVNVNTAISKGTDIPEDHVDNISGSTLGNIADWSYYYSVIENKAVKDRIIVVGAVSHSYTGDEVNYKLAAFSNTGKRVDVMAPGVGIESAVRGVSEYDIRNGTSMAAPHVSGVAASVWAYNNTLNGAEVKKAVTGACFTDVAETDVNMVNMLAALAEGGDGRAAGNPARYAEWTLSADVYGEGALIPDVAVTLLDSNNKTVEKVTTDADGYFEIPVGVGRYTLKLTCEGYADTVVENVIVNMDNVDLGDITLSPMVRDFTLPESVDITLGEVNVIEPTLIPAEAGSYTIKWTSSDDSILSIAPTGEAGIITARNKGSVTVTAELTSGSNVITKTTTVNVVSVSRDTVLVLDISGSMSGTPLSEMKKAAINFCTDLLKDELNNRVGIVFYESYMESIPLTEDLESLISIIESVDDKGSTNMVGGLKEADAMLKEYGKDNAIKNVIIMADGLPNRGDTSNSGSMADAGYTGYNSSVKYANAVIDTAKDMMTRYNMYSLGYFHSLYNSDKDFATILMKALTNKPDGYYQVDKAEDIEFAFGDLGDEIGSGDKIVINIACPVDVYIKLGEETLCSAEAGYNDVTSFGTLKLLGKDKDIKVVTLDSDKVYDVEVLGTGEGTMNYSVNYFDESEELVDSRNFENVPITEESVITSNTENTEDVVLNVDDNGDGVIDSVWTAPKNGSATVTYPNDDSDDDYIQGKVSDDSEGSVDVVTILIIVICAVAVVGVVVVLMIVIFKKPRNNRGGNTQAQSVPAAYVYTTPASMSAAATVNTRNGFIRVLNGSMKGANISINDNETVNIGKDPRVAQVVFSKDYQFVSRLHCSITYDAQANVYYVTDQSSNGTFYSNKIRLEKGRAVAVKPNTTLILGTMNCTISLG